MTECDVSNAVELDCAHLDLVGKHIIQLCHESDLHCLKRHHEQGDVATLLCINSWIGLFLANDKDNDSCHIALCPCLYQLMDRVVLS